jgi:hypothetical protein
MSRTVPNSHYVFVISKTPNHTVYSVAQILLVALYMALGKLGYKAYHFREIFSEEGIKNGHMFCWEEALTAKLEGRGKSYGREEFDKILGNYSVSIQEPASIGVKQTTETGLKPDRQ